MQSTSFSSERSDLQKLDINCFKKSITRPKLMTQNNSFTTPKLIFS